MWAPFIDAAGAYDEKKVGKPFPAAKYKPLISRIYNETAAASNKPAYLAQLGWVMRRVNEPGVSVALLKKVLELEPSSRAIRRAYAEALLANRQSAEAERQFNILLKSPSGGE